jgi:hypothetical protein
MMVVPCTLFQANVVAENGVGETPEFFFSSLSSNYPLQKKNTFSVIVNLPMLRNQFLDEDMCWLGRFPSPKNKKISI